MDFNAVRGLEMDLEAELTLALVGLIRGREGAYMLAFC